MVQPAARTEWIDSLYTRPVARVCVAVCAPLALPPWVWAVMWLLHGVAAAVFLALGWGLGCAAALAGFLPWGAASLELSARAGQAPGLRRPLHGWVLCASWVALHVGLAFALLREGEGRLGSLALTLGAALSLWVCALALGRAQRAADTAPPLTRPSPDAVASAKALSLLRLVGPSTHAALLAVLAAANRPVLYAWLTLIVLNALALLAIWLKRPPRALGAG